jgi:hypothetical protein
LDDLVDLFIEREVIGVDGVEHDLGDVDELVRSRAFGLGERVDLGLLHRGDATKRSQDRPVGERWRPVDEVAVRDLAVITRRQEQVFAALAHPMTRGETTPADRRPRRIATSDAPGTALRNTSMPRIKSRASYAFATVPWSGRPSKKSSAPNGDSTRLGDDSDAIASRNRPSPTDGSDDTACSFARDDHRPMLVQLRANRHHPQRVTRARTRTGTPPRVRPPSQRGTRVTR